MRDLNRKAIYKKYKINMDIYKNLLPLIIALVFILIFSGIGLFLFFSDTPLSLQISNFVGFKNGGEKTIGGGAPNEIYLSLAPKGNNLVNLYALNVENGRFSPLFDKYGDKNFGNQNVGYTSRYSPDGNKLAYIAASRETAPDGSFVHGGVMSVFVLDTESGESQRVSRGIFYPRLPQWSRDEKRIVFTGFETGGLEPLQPNNWNIYVTDLNGAQQRVTHGTFPYWSPDGDALLFMRSDGLHVYDLKTQLEEQIYFFRTRNATTAVKIGLSLDGSMLAISSPSTQEVFLYKVFSWEPFQMDLFKTIRSDNRASFWPVFSPDNRFVVLQQIDWDTVTRTSSNPRLVVYDLENFKGKTIASLADFNFDFAFTSDWRYNKESLFSAAPERKQLDTNSLKSTLVDGSPWAVTWDISGKGFKENGTQEIIFSMENNSDLSGRFSYISTEVSPGPMKDISLRDDGCVRFVSAITETAYVYCLADNGTLQGYVHGISPQGNAFVGDFTGTIVAWPASR